MLVSLRATRGGTNSIPDVFSASRSNGNSKMARAVDEIHDFLRDYFVGFFSIITLSDLCLSILHHFVFNF